MNESKSSNKGVFVIISVLCVAVIALTIAYAALSSTLRINFGNVTQSEQTWSVAFVGSEVDGVPTGTSNVGLTCGKASISSDQVTVANTTISKPGDKCVYSLSIQNNGSINANLATITNVKPSGITCTESGASMVCGNITYKLATDATGSTLLTTNTALNASASLGVYLVVEYTGADVSSSSEVQNGAGFTLLYNQA